MAEPVGYIVAARTPDGTWVTDTCGMWPTRAEADEDKADAEKSAAGWGADGDRFVVCGVVPLEDGDG